MLVHTRARGRPALSRRLTASHTYNVLTGQTWRTSVGLRPAATQQLPLSAQSSGEPGIVGAMRLMLALVLVPVTIAACGGSATPMKAEDVAGAGVKAMNAHDWKRAC